MLTPEERYNSDPSFRVLVDLMESMLHKADYTPSELRMAAILAYIHYENRKPHCYSIRGGEKNGRK